MWECPNCGHENEDDDDDMCEWCGYILGVNNYIDWSAQ